MTDSFRSLGDAAIERDVRLAYAIKAYTDGPYYPFGAAVERNDAEFDFCNPDENAHAMAVHVRPIYVEPDCIGNFVVWQVGDPSRWWRWDTTRTPVLGIDQIHLCFERKQPVQLVQTPARWAELVGYCACVLDWSADLRAIFGETEVDCEDPELEKAYARAWRGRKFGPRIRRRSS